MRKSAGFTLIELVIVIIILGILGAVAAPRLFNLQGDAYGANLNAMKSSISTAMTMANAKAQIVGKLGDDTNSGENYTIESYTKEKNASLPADISFKYGYPIAGSENDTWNDGILGTLENFEDGRYTITVTPGSDVKISPASLDATNCYVTYNEAKSKTERAEVIADISGC